MQRQADALLVGSACQWERLMPKSGFDEVAVREIAGEQVTVLELRVAPTDLGKVIGKQGRTARSIRTLLGAAGMKLNRRFTLEILE